MNRIIATFALLAAAPVALAQSWEFELGNPILTSRTPSTTVTLSIDPGPAAYALAVVNFNVHATEPGWSDNISFRLQPGVIHGPHPGTISGPSVIGISNWQLAPSLVGIPLIPGRVDVWRATFTVTDFTERQIDLRTETTRLSVYLDASGETREDRTPIEGAASITVIPAPAGAAALLGAGAVATLRRRRRKEETPT